MSGWSKKRKGCAYIYTHPNVDGAVVDRRGFGINAAMGANITWKGWEFDSVEQAKTFALGEF